jgi:DNA-binding response OmpR family regulator
MHPKTKRVLCIEPSADVCELLLSLLTTRGFDSDSATTIKEAVEKASSRPFDLYIVDDYYADGTNKELIRRLRTITPAVPVLVFSTLDFVESRRAALEAGASDYLIQPRDLTHLLGAVGRLCGALPAAST